MRPGEPVPTKLRTTYKSQLAPLNNGISFESIGCLKDGTQVILLSLQRIPFANNRAHFGQYRGSATQLASVGSAFLAAVRGAALMIQATSVTIYRRSLAQR